MSKKKLFNSLDVGNRFRRWLRREGYTSVELSNITGLSESTVARLRQGSYTLKTIEILAMYTTIDTFWLLNGTEKASSCEEEVQQNSSMENHSRSALSKGIAELSDGEVTLLNEKLVSLYKASIERSRAKSFDEIFTPYAMSHDI